MKKSLFSLLFIAVAFSAPAQQVDDELRGLIQKSFTYFPRIQELQQQVDISQMRQTVSKAGYLPSVTGNLTYSYLDPVSIIRIPTGATTFNEIQTQPYSNQNINVGVSQMLYDFGKVKHSVEKAKYDILIANDNLELNKTILAAQVAGIYFSIIYLEQSIVVQDSVISYFNKYKKLTDNRVKQGDALEFDALSAQSNIDQAVNRKVDLQNLLQKQYNLMFFCTGINQNSLTRRKLPDFPLGAVSEDSLLNIAKLNNRDIAISRNRILQQEEDVLVNQKNLAPTLSFNGALGFKNGYQPDIFQTRFNYLVGVGLAIPIYSGNRNRTQLKISQSSLQAARYAATGTEITVRRDMEQALADIQASSDRLRNIESQIVQSTRAMQLANSRMKNGTITYLELLNAQTNLQQAYLSKLKYEYDLIIAKVEMARLMGLKYW